MYSMDETVNEENSYCDLLINLITGQFLQNTETETERWWQRLGKICTGVLLHPVILIQRERDSYLLGKINVRARETAKGRSKEKDIDRIRDDEKDTDGETVIDGDIETQTQEPGA